MEMYWLILKNWDFGFMGRKPLTKVESDELLEKMVGRTKVASFPTTLIISDYKCSKKPPGPISIWVQAALDKKPVSWARFKPSLIFVSVG